MSIRSHTVLQLKPSVQMADVIQAFKPFLDCHGILQLHPLKQRESGSQELHDSNTETAFHLNAGALTFYISCTGDGHGTYPEGLPEVGQAMEPLLASPGVVEVIDHDISASNSEAVVQLLFVPADFDGSESLERKLIGAARIRQILQEMMLEPDQVSPIELAISKCMDGQSDEAAAKYTDRDALLEMLNGIFSIGFGADVPIDGADAVQTIAEVVDDLRHRQLPKLGIRFFKIHSESSNGFWSNQMGWVDADCATLYAETPTLHGDQRAVPVTMESTFGVEIEPREGMTLEEALELATALDEGVCSLTAAIAAIEEEYVNTQEPSPPLQKALALLKAAKQLQSPNHGSIGKHDWAVGPQCEDGYLVHVDDRPISYRPTMEQAKDLAFEVIHRLQRDGDYRLNDRPAGFMPPA